MGRHTNLLIRIPPKKNVPLGLVYIGFILAFASSIHNKLLIMVWYRLLVPDMFSVQDIEVMGPL
jgi:hypothetical protein